jgi:hypothetical protein
MKFPRAEIVIVAESRKFLSGSLEEEETFDEFFG